MSEFTVIDKKGVWVRNTSEFGLADHQRHSENPDTPLVILAPGVATRINMNDYLKGQPTLEILTHDPISGDEIKAKAPAVDIGKEK